MNQLWVNYDPDVRPYSVDECYDPVIIQLWSKLWSSLIFVRLDERYDPVMIQLWSKLWSSLIFILWTNVMIQLWSSYDLVMIWTCGRMLWSSYDPNYDLIMIQYGLLFQFFLCTDHNGSYSSHIRLIIVVSS